MFNGMSILSSSLLLLQLPLDFLHQFPLLSLLLSDPLCPLSVLPPQLLLVVSGHDCLMSCSICQSDGALNCTSLCM